VELGKTYFAMREDDAAQENLAQAVALVCKDCPLYDSSAILADPNYTAKTGSLKFFTEERKLPPTILMSAWNRLGQVYYTRRNYESAIAILEEAIACGERSQCGATPKQIPIESYYVTASAYFYLDKCTLAESHAKSALDIYVNTRLADPNIGPDPGALSTILCVFKLCRDSADTPVTYQGDGFTNGFPNGYEEPDCRITRGSVGIGGNPGTAGGTSTPEPPTPTARPGSSTGPGY
jgi:tetratricopeptide (TPR) repeat protein